MSRGRRSHIGPSESQANADALYRREHTWSESSGESFKVAWDFRQREPRNLREAVHYARQAYADEVPTKLHDGPDAIGEGGTPRFTGAASGYLFGSAYADDRPKPKCSCPPNRGLWQSDSLVTHDQYEAARPVLERKTQQGDLAPVVIDGARWTPKGLEHVDECPVNPKNAPLTSFYLTPFRAALERMVSNPATARRGRIVSHITIGQMGPVEAALKEKAHPDDAQFVAERALRIFLRGLTDMKVHIRRQQETLQENETAA